MDAMMQCGRGTGKTEVALNIATRWAMTWERQLIYILAPQRKQCKEIYWLSRRLQDYPHPDFVLEERESELALVFKNGSKIVLNGSDNYAALRGVKPNLVIYDEFQDINPLIDVAMGPNRGSKRAPLIRIGTPPDNECYYTQVRQYIMQMAEKGSKRHFYIERPTWTNPFFDREFLNEERERLRARGDADVFEREYAAKFIPGGARAVFPMWHREKFHILQQETQLPFLLDKDKSPKRWFAVCDPGQSCFAVIIACVTTKGIYILDEIYERDRSRTTAGQIWPRIRQLQGAWNDRLDEWKVVVDEAASWFPLEVQEQFKFLDSNVYNIYKTAKHKRDKKDDLSILKDMMLAPDAFYINKDACRWTQWEIENYITKEDGRFYDKDDHLIDSLRYLIAFANFRLNQPLEVEEEQEEVKPKPLSIAEMYIEKKLETDPFWGVAESVYDEELDIDKEWTKRPEQRLNSSRRKFDS